MRAILRRLRSDTRWWTAEIVLRASGLVLLGLCAALSLWLHQSFGQVSAARNPGLLELCAATLTFLCWSAGWALTIEGPGLFRRVRAPGRFPLSYKETIDHERPDVARRAGGADAADARLRAPVRAELSQ